MTAVPPVWRLAGLAALCAAAALVLAGPAAFGRLALALGQPRAAAALLGGDWQGAALLEAGRPEAAAGVLPATGPAGLYNLGLAEARSGRLAAALEAFDAQLARHPEDAAARTNFDLIAKAYGATAIEPGALLSFHEDRAGDTLRAPVAQGNARAASTGEAVTNAGPNMGLPLVFSEADGAARKVFDDKVIRADPRWLATLEDVPGRYLAARIEAEWKRRQAAGLSPPAPEDPL